MTRQSLSQKVEVKIHRLIAEGHLKSGDRLPPERDLAEAMNVARHTLRAAIKSLEHQGVLRSRQGSGTFIQSGPPPEPPAIIGPDCGQETARITDIFQFRNSLEPGIIFYAAERATKENLKPLRENLAKQRRIMAKNDREKWAEADVEFHMLLPQLTGNPLFIQVMNRLKPCLDLCVDKDHLNPVRMNLYYNHHHGIYEAIARHDAAEAITFLEEHLKHLPWQENLRVSSLTKI